MDTRIKPIAQSIQRILYSNWFFYVTIAFFIISSVWVATASQYPMAFDEEFHLGLIKIYSTQWLPYGIENTRDLAQYGSAASDPSYLFHYLMSFPYRLLDWLGLSQTAIIVILRFFNVALVVLSLVLYRKALLAAKVSKAVTHGAIAAFSLIPILPVMAGQLNYDNLLLVMVALTSWLLIRITHYVREYSKLPVKLSLLFLVALFIMLPIKYASLPIALGLGLWFAYLVVGLTRQDGVKHVLHHTKSGISKLSTPLKIGVVLLFVAGLFFSARYIENYIRYDDAIPSCSAVFDEDACLAYGPWARDFKYRQNVDPNFQPISFPSYIAVHWVPGMVQRLTFAVAGPTNSYQTKPPLPILWIVGSLFVLAGLLTLLRYLVPLVKRYPYIAISLLVSLIYMGSLAIKLYGGYSRTSVPVAINGRYLLPLIPFLFAAFAQSCLYAARKYNVHSIVILLLTAALALVFIQGGGVFTYIVQAESHWFYEGWGQASYTVLHGLLSPVTWQYNWFS